MAIAHSETARLRKFVATSIAASLSVIVLVAGVFLGSTLALTSTPYVYDSDHGSERHIASVAVSDRPEQPIRDDEGLGTRATSGYDERSNLARTSSRSDGYRLAPNTAGGGARFVANRAGDVLDTTRIGIPQGKFGYLLENPSKAGVFRDSLGFNPGSLDPALRGHLVDNFGTATRSVPMVGGGTKFSVTGPLLGPSGQKWTITSVWGVDPNGAIRLITATP